MPKVAPGRERAAWPIAVLLASMMTPGREMFGVAPPDDRRGADAVTCVTPPAKLWQPTVPFVFTALIACPDGQVPVTRSWIWAELTSTEPMVPSWMWAEVMPPGAILLVPDVVIGPPVRPDPVFTLTTVPPLLVSAWQTTPPPASIALMELPVRQLPVTLA